MGPNDQISIASAKAVTTAASNSWSPTSVGLRRWAAMPPPTTAISRKAVPVPSASRHLLRVGIAISMEAM